MSNTSQNNGIGGVTDYPTTEKGNIVTFSDTTTDEAIFYQPNSFVGYSHIQGMFPKQYANQWNELSYLYFVTAFRRAVKGKYSYGTKFNRLAAAHEQVQLPTYPDGSLAFDYMEAYVRELEAERVTELEAYLEATGLTDTVLLQEEQTVLKTITPPPAE